jgi:hypothetical protein
MIFALAACERKDIFVRSASPQDSEVEIAVSTTAATRTPSPVVGTTEENAIEELDVLIFDDQDNYLFRRRAYKVPVSYGYTNVYRATMPEGTDYNLQIFANCKTLLDAEDPTLGVVGGLLEAGTAWTTIREGLVDLPARLVPPTIGFALLPMWGTAAAVDIQRDEITQVAIEMLRSVASVDIDASPQVVKDVFELVDARFYYAPDCGNVAYTGIPVSPLYNEVPYVPAAMKTTLAPYAVGADAENKIFSKLYLYENSYNTRDNAEKQRTRIIIGGKFDGGATTYYPVDFIKHETQPEPHDVYRLINRNWKYLFNIVEVTGPGYEDPGTASQNFPVNMGVSVIEWNQVHEIIYIEGPYFISLARREAELFREAGSTDNIAITSNIPEEDLVLNFTTAANGTQVNIDPGIENDWFRVEKIVNSSDELVAFRITALQDYNSAHALDVVRVTYGRIEFELSIEQINQSQNGWDDGGGEDIDDL